MLLSGGGAAIKVPDALDGAIVLSLADARSRQTDADVVLVVGGEFYRTQMGDYALEGFWRGGGGDRDGIVQRQFLRGGHAEGVLG